MLNRITILDNMEYLRQISKEVDLNDKSLKQNIASIKEFCLANPVFAMAGVQLGIPKRLVYVRTTHEKSGASGPMEDKNIVLINPEILEMEGLTNYWEACASCLDNTAQVDRPYKIKIKYINEEGLWQTSIFEGLGATVLCHEIDHLNGILHLDRANKILDMPASKRVEFRKTNPYVVFNKTGEFKYNKLKTWKNN